ncbi:hypothetical protein [Lactobacillus delbrueckii]|uniref:hypothetical protein n=1 Tax=Lactobacillus delbrueckii TaxID=1584 RepID=UPI0039C8960E
MDPDAHVDGWRLDVADELPMPLLREIRERLQNEDCHVLIGEVWEDASHKFVNSEFRTYMAGDNLTGTMNYPVRNFIVSLLQANNETEEVAALNDLEKLVENYPKEGLSGKLPEQYRHPRYGQNQDRLGGRRAAGRSGLWPLVFCSRRSLHLLWG